jgi:8-oxo-dGTP pyrophosphatase MutT (NUDIX family)
VPYWPAGSGPGLLPFDDDDRPGAPDDELVVRTATPGVRRQAGRVVLVGPGDEVLLLSGRDPAIADAPTFWFVPGGGVHEGETVEDAARREVHEEVGARLGALGPVVWVRDISFNFDGCWYDQSECYYVVRTGHFLARPTALTELEQRATTGAFWWPLSELAASAAPVHPANLASLVAAWLTSGPPERPIRIE